MRETIEDTVLYTYYAFYLLVILFAFLILPLAFFFHLIGGDDGLQVRLLAFSTILLLLYYLFP